MTSYCVRRLVQNNKEQLRQQGIALSEKDLNDPDELLHKFVLGENERLQRIQNLEVLARAYQSLTSSGNYPAEVKETEQQILITLGLLKLGIADERKASKPEETSFESKTLKVSEVFLIFQSLLASASTYLGPKIASDYLLSTRPDETISLRFEMQANHKLKINGNPDDILLSSDMDVIRAWVKGYLMKCSEIINGFHGLVDKKNLEALRFPRS